MKKVMFGLVVLVAVMSGCTENQRARQFGGNAIETLPSGQKLVTATWKQDDLWLLYRPMREGEQPETYYFKESSSFGLLEGLVTIKEQK